MTYTADIISEAIKWFVPAILTALGGWWLVKRKAIRAWREQKRKEKDQFRRMVSGWGHMHETVSTMSDKFGPIAATVARTETAIHEIRAVLRAQSDLADDGAFQCTPQGSNTFVNLTYARMLGAGKADLQGNQWKNFIAPQDAERFLSANAAALAEHRPFYGRCHMVRSDGDLIEVDVTMYPDPERPPAQRWFGKIREVA